ncbi:M28 family peptidase, partial [bacterium]|nr:M28 family peptidase [bacterium]
FAVKNSLTDIEVNLKKITGRVSNVIGFFPGSDEKLQYEAIVFGAHFDHLGMGGSESNEADTEPKIHHGADDNSSGTALVLSLMEKLKNTDHKRTYVFALFNGEEMGLLGSKYMAENFERLAGSLQMKAMLNFDMVGRFDKKLSVIGVGSAFEWDDYINEYLSLKNKNDLPVELNSQTLGSSDHASFINNKVPSLFFTTGAHEDYHKSTDTFEKINFEGLKALEKMVLNFSSLIDVKTKITFDPKALEEGDGGRSRGYGSHLGCVPDMGSGDKITGVLCTRFVKDSPAQKAGLLPGDILVGIGDIAINSIYDLSFALKFHRPGDEIQLRWMREGVEMEAQITLTQRKH